MCIIIDTNTLAEVLNRESVNHAEYKPVHDWLKDGKGKIVYGGTKYIKEIGKYAGIFNELKKIKKAVYVDNLNVDTEELKISKAVEHKDFDDQHLVALLIISRCKLICSNDSRAYPFFRHSYFFSPANNKPRIYSGKRNSDLLVDRFIADLCKPCSITSVAQKKVLNKLI